MADKKVIYYSDELNEEFSNIERPEKIIADDYKYIRKNPLWNFAAFFIYRIIMTPIAFIYCKLKFHIKFVNRDILKEFKNHGYFLYGNHTQVPGDGYIPSLITFPKKPYEIVSPANVAAKFTEQFMLMIGAMPIPTGIHGIKNFMNAIETRLVRHNCITIYPEAHIWPYYTKIRPFKSVSFKYPVKFKDPTFCFTVTYNEYKNSRKPQITVYVDGPFYPDSNLSEREQRNDLRNRVYETMVERSKNSDFEFVEYRKRETLEVAGAEND